MKTILLVEDEPAIQEMLTLFLNSSGFYIISAMDFPTAWACLQQNKTIDLVVLDWMLPQGSGIQLLKQMKQNDETAEIPVIMLSAHADLDDRLIGLAAGADDYLAKPFSPKELLARILAVLRRTQSQSIEDRSTIRLGELQIDTAAHRLFFREQEIMIGRMEFKLLVFLSTHLERVYSRRQLLDHVWGLDAYIDERTVDVSIGRVRKILEIAGYGKWLQTVRGVGYRFSPEMKNKE